MRDHQQIRHALRLLSTGMVLLSLVAVSAIAQAPQVTGTRSDAEESLDTQDTAAVPQGDCAGFIPGRVDGWRLQKATVGATIVSATNSQQAYKTNVVTLRHRKASLCGAPHQQTKADFNCRL